MRRRKLRFLGAAIALVIAVIAVLLASRTSELSPSPPEVVIFSNTSYLMPGDELVIKVKGSLGGGYRLFIEPSELFAIEREYLRNDSLWVIAKVRNAADFRGPLSGTVILELGQEALRVPLFLRVGLEKPRIFSNGVILRLVDTSGRLELWVWEVGVPYDSAYRPFIAPALDSFELLEEYLSLELYVSKLMPRQNAWWPLSGFGPSSLNARLEEVISTRKESGYLLINVSRVPAEAKGVTLGLRGVAEVKRIRGDTISVTLALGFLDQPSVYIFVPANLSLTSVRIAGERFEANTCIYAPPGFSCYQVYVPKAMLSPFRLELELSKI